MKIPAILLFAYVASLSVLTSQPFTGSFNLVASQAYPNGNLRSDTMCYFFGEEKTAIIIFGRQSSPDMRMIFNPSDSTITALFEVNGTKGGYVLPMNEKHWPALRYALRPHAAEPPSAPNYTGDEKTIEGFRCRKVLAESSDYSAVLWMAEDIPLSMMNVLSYQSVGSGKSTKEIEIFGEFGVTGLPLELHLSSKQGKGDVIIHLVDFTTSIDDTLFSTDGYTIIDMK